MQLAEIVDSIARDFTAGQLGKAALDAQAATFAPAVVELEIGELFEALSDAITDYAHMQPTLAEVEDLLATARSFA